MGAAIPIVAAIIGAGGLGYSGYAQSEAQKRATQQQREQQLSQERANQDYYDYLKSPEYRAQQDYEKFLAYGQRPTESITGQIGTGATNMLSYGGEDTNFIPGASDLLSNPYGNQNVYSWM